MIKNLANEADQPSFRVDIGEREGANNNIHAMPSITRAATFYIGNKVVHHDVYTDENILDEYESLPDLPLQQPATTTSTTSNLNPHQKTTQELHRHHNGPGDDYEEMLRQAIKNSQQIAPDQQTAPAQQTTTIAATHHQKSKADLTLEVHQAIDYLTDKYEKLAGQNSCVIAAYGAYIYAKTGQTPADLPQGIKDIFEFCGQDQFDINGYLIMTHADLMGIDQAEVSTAQVLADMQQHNAHVAAVKNTTSAKTMTAELGDEIEIQKNNPLISSVNHVGNKMTQAETARLKNHLDEHKEGCLVLVRTKNSNAGHYVYYHPHLGFITGGTEAYYANKSGLTLEQFLATRASRRVEGLYIFDISLLAA
ncbi:MAG: hypothetical protein IT497_08545 [Ottowia sp.]|nr:hypothetical protein [Ottowia sp.]